MGPDAYLVATSDVLAAPADRLAIPTGLALAYDHPRLSVWVSSSQPRLRVTAISPSVVLIGDVYASGARAAEACDAFNLSMLIGQRLEEMSHRLVQSAWGRYVLISHTSHVAGAFRDPSGALDCVTWRRGDLRLFASRLPPHLDPVLPRDLSIDWSTVARQLHDPAAVSGASALRNIEAVAPGALWTSRAGAATQAHQVWRPSAVARGGWDRGADSAQLLRTRVQTSVVTLTQSHERLLGEVSGGLDSAIVAASLCHAPQSRDQRRDARWINYATDDPEGDERPYARAIASQLGIDLTERRKPPLRYDETTLAEVGADFRVGLTALDPDYDDDLAGQASDHRADALVTGQGGDVVFMQMATNEVLVDRLRGQGRMDLSELLAHSRRWRRSIWRTAGSTIWRTIWSAPRRGRIRPTSPRRAVRLVHPTLGLWTWKDSRPERRRRSRPWSHPRMSSDPQRGLTRSKPCIPCLASPSSNSPSRFQPTS